MPRLAILIAAIDYYVSLMPLPRYARRALMMPPAEQPLKMLLRYAAMLMLYAYAATMIIYAALRLMPATRHTPRLMPFMRHFCCCHAPP